MKVRNIYRGDYGMDYTTIGHESRFFLAIFRETTILLLSRPRFPFSLLVS